MERFGTARRPQLLGQKKDKFWLTVGLCALTAALFFLPFYIIDGGFSTMQAISTASRSAFTAI